MQVHLKWGNWITKSLILCLESTDYIEIRNALTVLTKISSVFPVTRKTGLNLEKRVIKIKGDDREDLKVLATGVAAALAARKSSWVSDEEFSMGLLDLKPASASVKVIANAISGGGPGTQIEHNTTTQYIAADTADHVRTVTAGLLPLDSSVRSETGLQVKVESAHGPVKSSTVSKEHISLAQAAANALAEASKSGSSSSKHMDDITSRAPTGVVKTDENLSKLSSKVEFEDRARRPQNAGPLENSRVVKTDSIKEDARLTSAGAVTSFAERDSGNRAQDSLRSRVAATSTSGAVSNGVGASGTTKAILGEKKAPSSVAKARTRSDVVTDGAVENKKASVSKIGGELDTVDAQETGHLPFKSPHKEELITGKSVEETSKDKSGKRLSFSDETDRTTKRRKGEAMEKVTDSVEFRRSGDIGESRPIDREKIQQDQRSVERARSVEHEKNSYDERTAAYDKPPERLIERTRERASERSDRDYRGDRSVDRLDRARDERLIRESSADKAGGFDRPGDRSREERAKDDRGRPRYADQSAEQPHPDDRFPMQHLPPPPPLPPNLVPQSLASSRREEDDTRRGPRLPARAPHRDEKGEKKRSEDGSSTPIDDIKRKIEDSKRKDDDVWERKREDRDIIPMKAEKEREREKDDISVANSKRRRLKRDHLSSEILPGPSSAPSMPSLSVLSSDQYDRDRDRKSSMALTSMFDESGYDKSVSARVHGKDAGKVGRREHDQPYDHDWDEDKRSRNDMKRRHHRPRSARDS